MSGNMAANELLRVIQLEDESAIVFGLFSILKGNVLFNRG